jgi:hypothetical protein
MFWLDAYASLTESWLNAAASVVGSLAWPVAVVILAVVFRGQVASAVESLQEFEAPGFKGKFRNKLDGAAEIADDLLVEQIELTEAPESLPASTLPPAQTVPPASSAPVTPTPTEQVPSTAPRAPATSPTDATAGAPQPTPGSGPTAEELLELAVSTLSWGRAMRNPDADPSGRIKSAWHDLYRDIAAYGRLTGLVPDTTPANRRTPRHYAAVFQANDVLDESAAHLIVELSELRNRVLRKKHIPTSAEAITYEQSADKLRSYIQFMSQVYSPKQ